MAKINHEDILAYLEEASILELNDLVKAIEEKFGVTAAAPVAVAAAPAEATFQGPVPSQRNTYRAADFLSYKARTLPFYSFRSTDRYRIHGFFFPA